MFLRKNTKFLSSHSEFGNEFSDQGSRKYYKSTAYEAMMNKTKGITENTESTLCK